ncbi:MAG: hypothetical protein GXX86_12025 [Propionibacterium sp.]|nr:hypothetical protein [Propionibacterium sp.]
MNTPPRGPLFDGRQRPTPNPAAGRLGARKFYAEQRSAEDRRLRGAAFADGIGDLTEAAKPLADRATAARDRKSAKVVARSTKALRGIVDRVRAADAETARQRAVEAAAEARVGQYLGDIAVGRANPRRL